MDWMGLIGDIGTSWFHPLTTPTPSQAGAGQPMPPPGSSLISKAAGEEEAAPVLVRWCSSHDRSVYHTVSRPLASDLAIFHSILQNSPLDLTKVRLQASGDKRMIESMKKTVRTAGNVSIRLPIRPELISRYLRVLIDYPPLSGVRGLFDGISGTWLRQMSYSMCRFWAYDESKKIVGATGKDSPAWKLAVAGSMGQLLVSPLLKTARINVSFSFAAGGIAGLIGNPGGTSSVPSFQVIFVGLTTSLEIVMVRLQGDFAKPPEKRFNYKHCFDALFRVSSLDLPSSELQCNMQCPDGP
jgi:hypothetical protein